MLIATGVALIALVVLTGARSRAPSLRVRPRSGPRGGAGAVAITDIDGDPCPPLIAAAEAARAACDEPQRAAAAAAETARSRAAEAEAAKAGAERATQAREAAEKELEQRQRPPETGRRLGETNFGGRHVFVDEYDLKLQADARAIANAAHAAAVAKATSEPERQQAHEEWQRELETIDGPDGLDEVRRRDRDRREEWVKEGEPALKAAEEAHVSATGAANRASEAADGAQKTADVARSRADEAWAAAGRAEAAAAECLHRQAGKPRGAGPPRG